ncbi:hypothetical protein DFQ26_008224 [Actinomortierella ambigua]|nr:hypothetical protein DFQ26_008224 [Actinomortierella ambigua]
MATLQSSTGAISNASESKKAARTADKQERLPAPLDPFGNEICRLFLKFGKCRYGKKCKLSHIKPSPDAPPPTRMVPVINEEPQPSIAPDIKFSLGIKRPRSHTQELSAPAAARRKTEDSTPTTPTTDQAINDTHMEEASTPVDVEDSRQLPPSTISATPARKRRKKTKQPTGSAPLLAQYFVRPTSQRLSTSSLSSSNRGFTPTTATAVNTFSGTAGKPASNTKKLKSTSNTTTVPADRIEQWYVSNRAELEPGSGRLMMTAGSPDTPGKKNQLKVMRRHHWECKQAVLQGLERTVPKTYALKLVRSRINWPRVTPYLGLVLQAAFELEITNELLPVLAMTVQAQLEHNAMGGRALEELVVSWGLSELQARRCGNLVWEMMVTAAGDASVAEGRLGVGHIVREMESKHDFAVLKERLSEFGEQNGTV